MKITGHCYCGKIRYEAEGPVLYQANCHCANCRRAIGAQAVAWITVKSTNFHYLSETPKHYRTETGAIRSFCPDCGSSLNYQIESREGRTDIVTASLDHPENFPPKRSVYIEEKLPWVICDADKK
jgi:hypothetical protein